MWRIPMSKNSHPHVAYPSKWLTKCFSFPHVCAITPPRHDSAHWELKSWRENLEILTYFWLPEPKIVSITLLLTRPGFVPGPWGFLTSWRHLEHQDEDSVICQWLGPESRDRAIAVSEQGPKMAKILRPRLSEMREIFTAFVLANANALWLFEWCSKDSKWVN